MKAGKLCAMYSRATFTQPDSSQHCTLSVLSAADHNPGIYKYVGSLCTYLITEKTENEGRYFRNPMRQQNLKAFSGRGVLERAYGQALWCKHGFFVCFGVACAVSVSTFRLIAGRLQQSQACGSCGCFRSCSWVFAACRYRDV